MEKMFKIMDKVLIEASQRREEELSKKRELSETTEIQERLEEFTYEPSEIIKCLYENTTEAPKRTFKKRKTKPKVKKNTQDQNQTQKFNLFNENSYYIKHQKEQK